MEPSTLKDQLREQNNTLNLSISIYLLISKHFTNVTASEERSRMTCLRLYNDPLSNSG